MASAGDVKAAIAQAKLSLAEAQELSRATNEKLNEALVKINWIRQTSVDPMGAPEIQAAIEACDLILPLCNAAIENAETYAGTL